MPWGVGMYKLVSLLFQQAFSFHVKLNSFLIWYNFHFTLPSFKLSLSNGFIHPNVQYIVLIMADAVKLLCNGQFPFSSLPDNPFLFTKHSFHQDIPNLPTPELRVYRP